MGKLETNGGRHPLLYGLVSDSAYFVGMDVKYFSMSIGIIDMIGNMVDQYSEILDAVNKEDVLCIDLVEEVGYSLGKNIAGLINIFNPEMVVVGGVLSAAGDYLLQPIRAAVRKHSLNMVNKDTKIVVSKLGANAGLIGACMLSRANVFKD